MSGISENRLKYSGAFVCSLPCREATLGRGSESIEGQQRTVIGRIHALTPIYSIILNQAAARRPFTRAYNSFHMIPHWLRFKRQQTPSTLTAIYIATAVGEPMQSVASIEAVEGRGLQGDRYCSNAGHWQSIEGCQATLITAYDLQHAKHKAPIQIETALDNGGHRRNLVVDGLKTKQLEGKSFRIGGAVFRYDKPRPPCGYIDKVSGKGMGKALGHYSGICIKVISGGLLTVGDSVIILDEAE